MGYHSRMDTSRRGFLKLMGLGTAGMAVGPSLFSSEAGAIPLVGQAEHYVFQGNAVLTDDSKAYYLVLMDDIWTREYGDRVGLLMMGKSGVRPFSRQGKGWTPVGDGAYYRVDCPIREGSDPYVEFYLAASKLRDNINADVQEFSSYLRDHNLVMVSMVDMPITALPHDNEGFYLETHIRQFATYKRRILNIDQALSTRGEVPIEVPNTIEFKYLMLMQEELRAMGMLGCDRNAVAEANNRIRRRQKREGPNVVPGLIITG